MGLKYAFSAYNKELMARVAGRDLSISKKQSVEICKWIKGRSLKQAKQLLTEVIAMKRAVPFTRFNWNVGHRPGMCSGRYPINAATQILALLRSAEANAQVKGLNTGNLCIIHCNAQKASTPYHYGRQRGTKMKRTHIEIVLQEKAQKEKQDKKKEQEKQISNDKEAKSEKK